MCFYRNLSWRGDFITGDPGRFVQKALEMGISFYRGSVGEPQRELIYRYLEREMKGAQEVQPLSLRELCEGNWSGVLYWEPWRMCEGRLCRRASLSIGAPLGNLGARIPGTLKDE